MNPRSGLALGGGDFCLFATRESDTESVRDLRIVSLDASRAASESLQPRTRFPLLATHPERRSLGPPPGFAGAAQLLPAIPLRSVQALSALDSVRCDTEYMSAAKDETATASTSTATSSSPIMRPPLRRVRE